MSYHYNGRYGLSGEEVNCLASRWSSYVRDNSVWENLDEFLLWASQADYFKGARLFRYDESRPFGPDNAYWFTRKQAEEARKERRLAEGEIVSPFCKGCQLRCPGNHIGCASWREYYVQNWNRNIHRPKPKPPEPPKREVFLYEHPDLVREGIVFENRTN